MSAELNFSKFFSETSVIGEGESRREISPQLKAEVVRLLNSSRDKTLLLAAELLMGRPLDMNDMYDRNFILPITDCSATPEERCELIIFEAQNEARYKSSSEL